MKKLKLLVLFIAITVFGLFVGAACSEKEEKEITIVLSSSSVTLDIGQNMTLSADIKGTKESVSWSVADDTVVSVSDTGTIIGLRNGQTKVYAEVGSVRAECAVTVEEGFLSLPKTVLNCGILNLFKGYGYDVSASFYIGAVEQEVSADDFVWTSDDESIATVSNGKITAIKNGTTNINVSYEYNGVVYSDSKTINVSPFAMLMLDAAEASLATSVTYGGQANTSLVSVPLTIKKVDGLQVTELNNFDNVFFTSSDEAIVTVDAEGKAVAGEKAGKAVITASMTEGEVEFVGTIELEVVSAISSKYDMDMLALAYARNTHADDWGENAKYILTNDIDYNGEVFIPIAAHGGRNIAVTNNYIGLQWKTLLAENDYGITYDEFKARGLNHIAWHVNANTESAKSRFNGVFDGNGYTISNAKMMFDAMGFYVDNTAIGFNTGIFGSIGEKGVLKNTAFVNFSRQGYAEAGYAAYDTNNATQFRFDSVALFTTGMVSAVSPKEVVICPERTSGAALIGNIYGAVENIFVQASYDDLTENNKNLLAAGMQSFIAFNTWGTTSSVKNCCFDITGAVMRSGNVVAFRCEINNQTTVDNVIIYGLKQNDGASGVDIAKSYTAPYSGEDVQVFESADALKAACANGMVEIGDDWNIDEVTGLPKLNLR